MTITKTGRGFRYGNRRLGDLKNTEGGRPKESERGREKREFMLGREEYGEREGIVAVNSPHESSRRH